MRTLFGRVLLVVLGVAVLAVVATALVADRIARDDLDEALDRDFEAEQIIYSELATYAFFTGSWEGVGEVVEQLAVEFDERVALTDLDGRLLADSAADDDGSPPDLPPREVAFIDPFSDSVVFDEALAVELGDTPFIDELDVDAVIDCLDASGVPFELIDDGFDVFPVVIGDLDEDDEARVNACFVDATFGDVDVEPALLYLGDSSSSSLLADGPDWRLLALIGAVVAAAALATWLAVRPLFRPLASLGRAAQAVADGDLSARADERGVDELRTLASEFNGMASSLEAEDERRRQLTTDIAHELRTPLANIRGYLEAAQDGLVDTDAVLVDSLHDDTVLLQHLVDDLQTLALADAGVLAVAVEPVAVDDVFAATVASHQAEADDAGVSLQADPAPESAVAGDPRRLRQVLGNLVSNAIRHTDGGGSVELRSETDGTDVVLRVHDDGEGIEPDDLARVFDRFARVDSSRNRATGGSGLGLAISRQLVEAMGGRISATSTPGDGSVFEIRLPSAQAVQATSSSSPR